MSDFVRPSWNYDPSQDEQTKADLHGQSVLATHLIPGLIASLLPDPNGTGISKYIPVQGLGAGLVHMGDAILTAHNYINRALPSWVPTLPEVSIRPDVKEWADRVTKGTEEKAQEIVPNVAPTTPGEEAAARVGMGAGSLGIPIPGVGGVKALDTTAKVLLPGLVHSSVPLINAGISSGIEIATAPSTGIVSDTAPATPTTPASTTTLPIPPIPPTTASTTQPAQPTTPATTPLAPFDAVRAPETDTDWKTGLLYGAGALTVAAFGPKAYRLSRDLMRLAPEARWDRATRALQDYETRGPTTPGQKPPEAPLPGVTPGVRAVNETLDSNAKLNAVTDFIAANPTEARVMRAKTGLVNNDYAQQGRIQYIADTGADPVSGRRMPSIVDHFGKVADLTDVQKQAYADARYAANELNDRARMRNLPVGQQRVGLAPFDDAALTKTVQDARRDPQIAHLLDESQQMYREMVYIAEARNFFDATTTRNLIRDHPDYLPTASVEGLFTNPFTTRDLTPEIRPPSGRHDPWELDKQYFEKFFQILEQNEHRSDFVEMIYDWQRRTHNQGTLPLLKPSKNSVTGEWIESPDAIPVRVNGELQYHTPTIPELKAILEWSPPATGAIMNGLNTLRSLSQQALTGALSVLGSPYLMKNAAKTAQAGAILKQEGAVGGYLDKALTMVTGKPNRWFGDPTAAWTWPIEIPAIGYAHSTHFMGKVFESGASNGVNKLFRQVFGDAWTDAFAARMQAAYENSNYGQMRAAGVTNSAGQTATWVPHWAGTMKSGSPIGAMVPELFAIKGWGGKATPYFIKFGQLWRDLTQMVGETGQAQYFRLNNQLSPELRAQATRTVSGDPGVQGAAGVTRGLNAITPYLNITEQATAANVRSVSKEPVAYMSRYMTAIGIPMLASVMTAMALGKDYVNHLLNERDNREAVRDIPIYIPGQRPEAALRLPVDNGFAPLLPTTQQGLFDIFNLQAHEADEDHHTWLMNGLMDFFQKHITTTTLDRTMAGVGSAVSPNPPVGVREVANLLGKNMDISPDNIYNNWGSGITNMISRPITKGLTAPNRMPGADSITGGPDGNIWKQLISNFFGAVAASGMDLATASFHSIQGDQQGYNLHDFWRDFGDRQIDAAGQFKGILWNSDGRLSSQPPMVQRVQDALESMRPFGTWKGDLRSEGLTRARGTPLIQQPNAMPDAKISKDPDVAAAQSIVGQYSNIIEQRAMPQIRDLEKQIKALPKETPRVIRNDLQRQLHERYEGVADMINAANNTISHRLGRKVTVNDDLTKYEKH